MTDAATPLTGPTVLAFSDRRGDDFAVSTPDGVVARMDVAVLTSRFRVVDAANGLLCAGEIPFGSFGRRWAVTAADGGPLLEVGVGWGRAVTVTYADGRTGEIRGQLFRRDWEMTDPGGTVLRAVPDASAWGFRPDAWTVQQNGQLTLAQFVATVETYRRIVQRRRSAG